MIFVLIFLKEKTFFGRNPKNNPALRASGEANDTGCTRKIHGNQGFTSQKPGQLVKKINIKNLAKTKSLKLYDGGNIL